MPVEVVAFMGEAARRQALALRLEPVAVAVLRAQTHKFRALDHTVAAGDAQAALHAVLLAGGLQNLRIDELDQLAVVIDYDDAAQDAEDAARLAALEARGC